MKAETYPTLVEVLGPTTCAGCFGEIPAGAHCLCVPKVRADGVFRSFEYYHPHCAPIPEEER